MKWHRIDSTQEVDPVEVAKLIHAGFRVIVQYSKSGYSTQQLTLLNELAKTHGRNLEIRFFGHYSEVFDASVLRLIPDAQSISMDCLRSACNLETLSEMHSLVELTLGIFELDDADILTVCNTPLLEVLTLGGTRKGNIDLGRLSRCVSLERLHTTGQTKNISTLCDLPSIWHLSLSSIKKKDDIGFVSSIPALKTLRLLLGGRSSIAEITSPQLQALEVVRVQGLEDIGDLERFENLESLLVEDQIRLAEIHVGPNPQLDDIKVINCKTLERISGVDELEALSSLRIARTAIDYEEFIAGKMPGSLHTLAFYTGKSKRDSEIRKDLAARGFQEF